MYDKGSYVEMKKPHACTIKSTGKKANRWEITRVGADIKIRCTNCDHVTIYKAQDGFMKVDVKKGSGRVILKFIPRGFKEGIGCFIFGIALFTLYNYKKR